MARYYNDVPACVYQRLLQASRSAAAGDDAASASGAGVEGAEAAVMPKRVVAESVDPATDAELQHLVVASGVGRVECPGMNTALVSKYGASWGSWRIGSFAQWCVTTTLMTGGGSHVSKHVNKQYVDCRECCLRGRCLNTTLMPLLSRLAGVPCRVCLCRHLVAVNHDEGWYVLLTRSLMGHAGAQPTYNLTQGDLEPFIASLPRFVLTRAVVELVPASTHVSRLGGFTAEAATTNLATLGRRPWQWAAALSPCTGWHSRSGVCKAG